MEQVGEVFSDIFPPLFLLERFMIYKILLISFLIAIICYLSYLLGKTKKELKYTKEEKEQLARELSYVQETSTLIHNLTSDDVNDKLQQIANKK